MTIALRTALGLLLAVACLFLIRAALISPVSFDGAMNLEVARSLAVGDGYRRSFADAKLFPHEVQTHATYILPSAAVIAFFGVTQISVQLVNLAYLLAFGLLVWLALSRMGGTTWGMFGTLLVLTTPGMTSFALGGYGELIALFWWLSGSWLLLAPARQNESLGRILVAGVLLGLALATKTVLLIGVAATTLTFSIHGGWPGIRRKSIRLAILAVGVALPLLLFEAWKLGQLGWIEYVAWWGREAESIFRQAGVSPGFKDSAGVLERIATHGGILADELNLSPVLLGASLMVWVIAALWLLIGSRHSLPSGPLLGAIALAAGVYFAWWLGMTPTEKAWFRRIFNGVVLMHVGAVLIAIGLTYRMRQGGLVGAMKYALAACVLSGPIWWSVTWSWNDAVARSPAPLQEVMRVADTVRELPDDARLFGLQWYSAPTISLYSGRHIEDLQMVSLAVAHKRGPVFLVLDAPALAANVFEPYLARFKARDVLHDAPVHRLYRVESALPRAIFDPAEIHEDRLRACVDMGTDYPYLYGFHRAEEGEWRWSKADAELLLRPVDAAAVALDIYTPDPGSYVKPGEVVIDAWLDDCHLGSARIQESGRHHLHFPLPCEVSLRNESVRLRVVVDRVLDAPDSRKLGIVVRRVGWAAGSWEALDDESNACPTPEWSLNSDTAQEQASD